MAYFDLSKDIGATKKKWFQQNQMKDPFKNITNTFIDFLRKSGEKDCDCKNSFPIFKTETYPDGTKYSKIRCSICGGQYYKKADYSFVMLILGRKGGGKTTSVFMYADLLHTLDSHRKVKLWQCPQNLITVIHNLRICGYYKTVCERAMGEDKWSKYTPAYKGNPDEPVKKDKKGYVIPPKYQNDEEKHRICKFTDFKSCTDCEHCPYFQRGKQYFQRIDKLEDIEYNDIVILDEGIISVNAKEALSKKMRNWDKFLAVVRHFRVCLFVLFQRFEVIKSLRQMSDMILYKSLPTTLVEEEKQDQVIKKYGQRIIGFERGQGLLVSSHQDFDKMGVILNKVPEWYTNEVSMSYSGDMSFISEKDATKVELDRAREMAQWLIDQNYPPIVKPNEKSGAKFKLREHFSDWNPPPSSREFTIALDCYNSMTLFDGIGVQNDEEFRATMVNDEENMKFFEDMKKANITEVECAIFHEVMTGKSVTEFNVPPYNEPKQRVTEIMRKVGLYYEQMLKKGMGMGKSKTETRVGEDAERKVVRDSWKEKGYALRSVGSGGERGTSPSPDVIVFEPNGTIRVVQVKERGENLETYKPLTFNAELKIINRMRKIAQDTSVKCQHCGEPVKGVLIPDKAFLYACAKDGNTFIEEPLEYTDNKLTIKVDWNKQQVIRQKPDKTKIKSPKLLEFLDGNQNIYWGNSEDLTDEEEAKVVKEQEEIINFDKLLEEAGIPVEPIKE